MGSWAIRWRDSVVDAFQANDVLALEKLAKAALKHSPSACELADSGAGFLLRDGFVWKTVGDAARADVDLALQKWREVKATRADLGTQHGHPLGPLKAKGFAAARAHFITFFADLAAPYANERFEREAATQVALRGFENFRQLQGLSKTDVDAWSNCVGAQALICKAVMTASAGLRSLNTQTLSDTAVEVSSKPEVSASLQGIGANALQVATSLADCSLPDCSAERAQSMKRAKLDGVGTSLAPKMALRTLATAQQHKEIVPILDEMVWETKLEANGRSLKSAASGLRAWHSYAVNILGYCEKQSLPPKSSKDAQRFVMIFANAGTAANYTGYVRYGCRLLELCTSWRECKRTRL